MTDTEEQAEPYEESTEDLEGREAPTVGPVRAPAVAAEVVHQNGRHRALSRDDILRARDLRTEQVDVPEWGGYLFVRGMTAGQRDRLEAAMIDKKGQPVPARLAEFRTRMFITCVVDERGTPMFDAADLPGLQAKSMLAMQRVLDVARRLSGMTDEDVDDLVGNSESGPSGSSSTA